MKGEEACGRIKITLPGRSEIVLVELMCDGRVRAQSALIQLLPCQQRYFTNSIWNSTLCGLTDGALLHAKVYGLPIIHKNSSNADLSCFSDSSALEGQCWSYFKVVIL